MIYQSLSNISKVKRKNKQEEVALVSLSQSGCQKSTDELIQNNMKLVINLANRFKNANLELKDLVGEGLIGLHEAINRFDSSKETKFTTYATYWAYNKIAEYVRRNSKSIRFPTYLLNQSRLVARYQQDFIRKNGKSPTKTHLCKAFELTPSQLERILSVFSEVESLDANLSSDNTISLLDTIAENGEHRENKYKETFSVLSEEELEMLELNSGVFQIKMPYRDLAVKYNKTYREVKKIIRGAKRKLAKELKKNKNNGKKSKGSYLYHSLKNG